MNPETMKVGNNEVKKQLQIPKEVSSFFENEMTGFLEQLKTENPMNIKSNDNQTQSYGVYAIVVKEIGFDKVTLIGNVLTITNNPAIR